MACNIREMIIEDYDSVFDLWMNTEQLALNECDTREGIDFYLRRNPGLSFVAEVDNRVVGAVICGHDGRRGYLRHLAVARDYRGCGCSHALVKASLAGLAQQNIGKCIITVEDSNISGLEYWRYHDWVQLDDTFRTLRKDTSI